MRGMVENYCPRGEIQPWPTKHNPYPDLQLHLNNQAIKRVNDITFHGIRISAKLSWNIYIDIIYKKKTSSDNWPDSQEFSFSPRTSSSHPVHIPGSSNPGVPTAALHGTLSTRP